MRTAEWCLFRSLSLSLSLSLQRWEMRGEAGTTDHSNPESRAGQFISGLPTALAQDEAQHQQCSIYQLTLKTPWVCRGRREGGGGRVLG